MKLNVGVVGVTSRHVAVKPRTGQITLVGDVEIVDEPPLPRSRC